MDVPKVVSKSTNTNKTRVRDIQRKFCPYYGMAEGPMTWQPFCGKKKNLVIITFLRNT